MSAYGHHMEREYSARTLPSREGSERTSSYAMESGFYMSSFATTIFIASLVTVGLLFITLLIALTVMLQSCESKSHGIIEVRKETYDSNYCHIYSLHIELNNFEAGRFPSICRAAAIQYIKKGQYARDLNSTMWMVEDYFGSVTPRHDGLDVVLIDIDDILSSDPKYFLVRDPKYNNASVHRYDRYGCSDCVEETKHLKNMLILRLYMKLQASGWPLILLSRKPEINRNTSAQYLASVGYTAWSSLIMRSEAELHMDSSEYFSKRRAAMQTEGFRITGIISSQLDALRGPYIGKRIFKLPNPMYYNLEHQHEDIHTPKYII